MLVGGPQSILARQKCVFPGDGVVTDGPIRTDALVYVFAKGFLRVFGGSLTPKAPRE